MAGREDAGGGGKKVGATDSARTGRFTRRQTTGLAGAAVALASGAWVFRPPPITDSPGWERVADMPASRGEMKAAVTDGDIYVPGGLRGIGQSTSRVDVYDPDGDEWTTRASLPTPLNHHGTAALDGRLYVVGGNESFTDPPGRYAYRYVPADDAWLDLTPLPDGRWGHELLAHDGVLYALGGVPDQDDEIWTLAYDPAADAWDRRAPIPTRREHVAAAAVGDRFYVFSGRWDDENTAAVAAYDPAADAWLEEPAIPTPRSGFGAAVIDGVVHTVGGEDPSVIGGWTTARHEWFDPATGEWSRAPDAPLMLHGNAVVAAGGRLFVIGGAWRQGALSVTAWSDRTFVFDPDAV